MTSNRKTTILVPRAAILLASASDRALAGSNLTVCDSRTSGSVQSRFFFKMVDLLHEALNHGMRNLDLSDITLKEKKYEGLKLAVLVISPLNASNTRSNF